MDAPFEPDIAKSGGAQEALIVQTDMSVEIESCRFGPGGKYCTCTLLKRTLL
jgi:hypothetical protein